MRISITSAILILAFHSTAIGQKYLSWHVWATHMHWPNTQGISTDLTTQRFPFYALGGGYSVIDKKKRQKRLIVQLLAYQNFRVSNNQYVRMSDVQATYTQKVAGVQYKHFSFIGFGGVQLGTRIDRVTPLTSSAFPNRYWDSWVGAVIEPTLQFRTKNGYVEIGLPIELLGFEYAKTTIQNPILNFDQQRTTAVRMRYLSQQPIVRFGFAYKLRRK